MTSRSMQTPAGALEVKANIALRFPGKRARVTVPGACFCFDCSRKCRLGSPLQHVSVGIVTATIALQDEREDRRCRSVAVGLFPSTFRRTIAARGDLRRRVSRDPDRPRSVQSCRDIVDDLSLVDALHCDRNRCDDDPDRERRLRHICCACCERQPSCTVLPWCTCALRRLTLMAAPSSSDDRELVTSVGLCMGRSTCLRISLRLFESAFRCESRTTPRRRRRSGG